MSFSVIIPARLASTRLPAKPLADIAGAPMVVRVAQRAARSRASRVVVAADHVSIVQACERHGVPCLLTRSDHASGSDRLAEACTQLGLADSELIVNVQGDEPLIAPELIDAVAEQLRHHSSAAMSTAAHAIEQVSDYLNPNVVKVVLNAKGLALYFSRAPIAWWREGLAAGINTLSALPQPHPLRHIGIYGYRAGFLRRFSALAPSPLEQTEALEQLRALWHGEAIAVHVSDHAPGPGVDTPEDLERVRRLFEAESRQPAKL